MAGSGPPASALSPYFRPRGASTPEESELARATACTFMSRRFQPNPRSQAISWRRPNRRIRSHTATVALVCDVHAASA